jgi:hypothetical protein
LPSFSGQEADDAEVLVVVQAGLQRGLLSGRGVGDVEAHREAPLDARVGVAPVGHDRDPGQAPARRLQRLAGLLTGVRRHGHDHDPPVAGEQVVGEGREQDPGQRERREDDHRCPGAPPGVPPPRTGRLLPCTGSSTRPVSAGPGRPRGGGRRDH